MEDEQVSNFEKELTSLINRHCMENSSDTPDFILARHLMLSLEGFNAVTRMRDKWWGGNRKLVSGSHTPGVGNLILQLVSLHHNIHGGAVFEGPSELPRLNLPSGLLGAVNNVFSFHDKFGLPWPDKPCWPGDARMALRQSLNDEEYGRELVGAIGELQHFIVSCRDSASKVISESDLPHEDDRKEFRRLMANVADGIIDTIYVLVGMAGEMGMGRLHHAWERVHRQNMAKEGGGKRGDGKVLKPDGWVPPDVEGAIFGE